MKVLHIIYYFNTGGAQKVVLQYLRQFTDDNLHMRVFVLGGRLGNSEFERIAREENLEIVYSNFVHSHFFIPFLRPVINYFSRVKSILKQIDEYHPQVVHSHITPILKWMIIPQIVCRTVPFCHTLHSDPYAVSPENVKLARYYFNRKKVLPLCLNETQIERAKEVYQIKRYAIARNGVDLSRFCKTRNTNSDIRKRYNIESGAFVIGFIGRLVEIKDIPFLLNVFDEVAKVQKNSVLLIVGDGPEREKLQSQVDIGENKGRVLFVGQQDRVEEFYFAMDVFCVTSHYESNSIVALEAQAAGVKCVVSEAVPKDVLVTDHCFRLSKNIPIETWRDVILHDDNQYKVKSGLLSDYDLDNCLMDLKNIYESLVKKGK